MSQYIFDNNGVTTLGSNLGSSGTTLTVAVGTGVKFPSPGAGQIVPMTIIAAGSSSDVPNEIVYATSRTGDTFVVIRGQEGTTAQNWSTGDTVANMATAEFYNEQATQAEIQTQAGNYAADTGAANAGVVALSPAPANLAALVGVPIRVLKMANPNTGAYTINVNGLGAEPVTVGGVAMQAGQLHGSEVFEVVWNGSNFDLTSPPGIIFNSNLAAMALKTIKANITDGAATPTDVTIANFLAFLGIGTAVLGSPSGHFTVQVLVSGVPVNIIVQYTHGAMGGSSATVGFPEAFPTACLFVIVADGGSDPSAWSADFSTYSTTGVVVHNHSGGGDYALMAIGY